MTTPLPSTLNTSTVASVHGWATTARENASMSAAAATVNCSTCRLPATCPQRRPIAPVAWSNEPRTATLGSQPPQPVAVAPPRQPQGRSGRVDACPAPGAPGTPAHHDRPEDAGQQPAVPGLDRAAGDAVGAGHRCRPLTHRPLLTDLAQVEVVLQQLPRQLPTPHLQQVLQLGGRFGAQLHGQAANTKREAANGSVAASAAQDGIGASFVAVGGVDAADATTNR